MKIADIPDRLKYAFGQAADPSTIWPLSVDSQIGIVDGKASLETGFPPLTMEDPGAGGVPPFGQDANAALNWFSSIDRWGQAGGPARYDPAFSANIGGYPKGAVLGAANHPGVMWESLKDDNLSDPDGSYTNDWASHGPAWYAPSGVAATMTTQHNDSIFLIDPEGNFTLTLPPVGSLQGMRFRIVTGGSFNFTLTLTTAGATDLFDYYAPVSNTSPQMQLGASAVYEVWQSSGRWNVHSSPVFDSENNTRVPGYMTMGVGAVGSGDPERVVRLGDFTTTASGFTRTWMAPDGWLFQMGFVSPSDVVVTLPQAYPDLLYTVMASNANAQGTYVDVAFGYAVSPGEIYLATKKSDAGGAPNVISDFPIFWMTAGRTVI